MGHRRFSVFLPLVVTGFGISACGGGFDGLDFDLRNNAGGFDTSSAAREATSNRPAPDNRGVISYPNYQVAVARNGDTVADVAQRISYDPGYLARSNGLRVDDRLNAGEILVLPQDVPTTPRPNQPSGALDIEQIATTAIDSAPQPQIARAKPSKRIDGPEPVRHRVERGETAYTIARLYNVSVRSLAEWNGLGPDLDVRQDQYLLIPVAQQSPPSATTPDTKPDVREPASGSVAQTPEPPSASKPLPEPEEPAKQPEPEATAAASKLLPPVTGKVLRGYQKRKNEGIDIESAAGTNVRAAEDGVVAAITRDTEQVPILVLRHPGNLLTVYANISDIAIKKGDTVKRGQTIAKVGNGSPPFLHFEVREGFDSVDPTPFLQ
jgi:murein DD-endopeptidase MepM/ murein hydrolase activator NlpD